VVLQRGERLFTKASVVVPDARYLMSKTFVLSPVSFELMLGLLEF